MKYISVPTRDQVSPRAQEIFDSVQRKLGKVPNLYATIAYSDVTLKAMLDFDAALAGSSFSGIEREAINLVVSQVNECRYCLAAHSFVAGKLGIPAEEIKKFRQGSASDGRLNTALQLAKAIAEHKGAAGEKLIREFLGAGFDEAALIELTGLVAIRSFTNYVFALTDIPVDFPPAPEL